MLRHRASDFFPFFHLFPAPYCHQVKEDPMKMNVPEAGRAEAGSLKITFILTISGLNAVSFRISGPLKHNDSVLRLCGGIPSFTSLPMIARILCG
jgi:hypothetical protein